MKEIEKRIDRASKTEQQFQKPLHRLFGVPEGEET